MLIRAADRDNIFAFHPQVPCIDIGGNIYPGKMTDMKRSVGIGKRGGDQVSFKFLHDVDNELITVLKRNKDNKIT